MPQPAPSIEQLPDLSHAIPARDIGKLPSTAEQFRALKSEIGKVKPVVANAKAKSDALHDEAEKLRLRLIETAARVQYLESEKIRLDAEIVRLAAEDRDLSASFVRDRASVTRLLAVLERLQHDMPPAMALRPDDALAATRGAMLIGASLPSVYGEAAALSRRIVLIKQTRASLIARRADGVRNAADLVAARADLNQLLAIKEIAARDAAGQYEELRSKLDIIASHASDLGSLLARVATLRNLPAPQSVVVVGGQTPGNGGNFRRGMLVRPVVGRLVPARDVVSPGPGIVFATAPGAAVVAPADGRVLFSGPYHKYGHVLILETSLGYDAVLAGLDRVDVRPEDQVLAGEPVGLMPKRDPGERLYFELRQNGRGIDPAPWLELRKAKKS